MRRHYRVRRVTVTTRLLSGPGQPTRPKPSNDGANQKCTGATAREIAHIVDEADEAALLETGCVVIRLVASPVDPFNRPWSIVDAPFGKRPKFVGQASEFVRHFVRLLCCAFPELVLSLFDHSIELALGLIRELGELLSGLSRNLLTALLNYVRRLRSLLF